VWGQRPGQLTYYIKTPNIILGVFIFLTYKNKIYVKTILVCFLARIIELYHKAKL
jgi:hypothetical protein